MDLIDRAVAVSDTTGFSYCCEGCGHIEQHFEILQMLAYRHFQYVCGIHVVGNEMV